MLITTTDILQNRNLAYLGLVACRSKNTKAIGKKDPGNYMAQETVNDINMLMTAEGEKLGADAVIGVRLTPESVTTFAVGTAVKFI
ncbi:MAG: heavy metal-binding domain-containing protein [Clostridiales bacterium]|nr:heavy metal-binding domain-containing protein [Clostridiales bacterium]